MRRIDIMKNEHVREQCHMNKVLNASVLRWFGNIERIDRRDEHVGTQPAGRPKK